MYEPCSSGVDEVRETLCSLGIPVELALDILISADYEERPRKLKVPRHPLHALGKYLKYCWQTLVRCSAMAAEVVMHPENPEYASTGMNWKSLVEDAIVDLFLVTIEIVTIPSGLDLKTCTAFQGCGGREKWILMMKLIIFMMAEEGL
ncbi:hypothetical protein N7478_001749 [Penicillium angulare]|uniref:uncharacterized protein n=1 Tax=Penicillium angulare TaxID=116970 RepID=UPI0025420211|nr:uncharacterized protein N7478_001749 [Penicillium angulare]KAJ5288719.1 hypothetical protein N7478_001749 [Penicillium angulare]